MQALAYRFPNGKCVFLWYLTRTHRKCLLQAKENNLYGTGIEKSEPKHKLGTLK